MYLKTSLVDELSGLYNKRFLKSYHFTNNSLIIMIDLDNFKLVNGSVMDMLKVMN